MRLALGLRVTVTGTVENHWRFSRARRVPPHSRLYCLRLCVHGGQHAASKITGEMPVPSESCINRDKQNALAQYAAENERGMVAYAAQFTLGFSQQ